MGGIIIYPMSNQPDNEDVPEEFANVPENIARYLTPQGETTLKDSSRTIAKLRHIYDKRKVRKAQEGRLARFEESAVEASRNNPWVDAPLIPMLTSGNPIIMEIARQIIESISPGRTPKECALYMLRYPTYWGRVLRMAKGLKPLTNPTVRITLIR